MKKLVLTLIFLFMFVSLSSASYLTQPIHSDKGLGAINIKEEKIIVDILKSSETDRNVVLNYIKTALFTDGYVLTEQDQALKEVLNRLGEEDRKKVEDVINNNLLEKKLKIKAIDIRSRDYYLPINLFNGE